MASHNSSEAGISDHKLVYGVLKEGSSVRGKMRYVRSYAKFNLNKLLYDLRSAPWCLIEALDNIDDKWNSWKVIIPRDFGLPHSIQENQG